MSWGADEFSGSGVRDRRQAQSLSRLADCLLAQPTLSFSSAAGSALRRAAWRIFSQAEVAVGAGHYQRTGQRCAGLARVLVSQDTTDLSYPTHPATHGLGDLGGRRERAIPGLCVHSALALSETGLPLGLVGQKVWAPVVGAHPAPSSQYPLQEKESYCWLEGLHWVEELLSQAQQVVLISDRDSDFYEYLSAPRPANTDLLLRVHHLHRRVSWQGQRCALAAVAPPVAAQVRLALPSGPGRPARIAQLAVSWTPLLCPPPAAKQGEPVALWLVRAQELAPPADTPALSWHLFTTLPVTELAHALRLLDYYRKRWVIERWHLVLKQGLRVERLQFDTFQRLANAIRVLSVVAWQLLCLKHLAAHEPELPIAQVFDSLQCQVLSQQLGTPHFTLSQALVAIAAFVGFTPSRKQPLPGEKVTWLAWACFNDICRGYQLARTASYGTG
jgi:hypothetical protein